MNSTNLQAAPLVLALLGAGVVGGAAVEAMHHAGSPAWLTGGSFGPEGGLTATIAILAATLIAARWMRKDTT